MKDPLISVVVPVYNVERYLRRCIDSLLRQTLVSYEIVLVDDGSTDGCPEICECYARKTEKVRVYHIENGGLGNARNFGVQRAGAELITFVDSDDYVEKRYLEDMLDLYVKYEADLVMTRIVRESESGVRRLRRKQFDAFAVDSQSAFFEAYSGRFVGWEAYGKIYRKQVLLSHPFPDGWYEDFACIYRIIQDCNHIVIGNCEENYHYITHGKSILTGEFNEKHLHVFCICDELREYIQKNYPEYKALSYLLYERAVIQLFNLQNLDTETKEKIYSRYKELFRRGMLPIITSKGISKESKAYSIVLGIGLRAFDFSKKSKELLRK